MNLLLLSIIAFVVGGNLSMQDTGISALGSDQAYTEVLYYTTNSTPHVVYGFESNTMQLWDVNLSNGVSRVISTVPGYPPLNAVIPTPQNSVVIGTSDWGYLFEYWPDTGVTNYIKKCSNRDYYSACLTTDGKVVLGTYGNSGTVKSTAIELYDPQTQIATELGKLDENQTDPVYVYTIGGDSIGIYGVIYTPFSTSIEWYLGTIDRASGAKVVYWKGGGSSGLTVNQGLTNDIFYATQTTNGATRYWQLNGTNIPTLLVSTPILKTWNRHSNRNRDPDTWSASEGWDVLATLAVVQVAGSIPQASLQWKKTTDSVWQTVIETNNWILSPYKFMKLVPFGSRLIWTTDSYGPYGTTDGNGNLILAGSTAGLSWYDILVDDPQHVYLAGYHNRTKVWDATSAFTYTVASRDTDTNVNPHFVTLNTLGKYHYYLAKGSNGYIYIGSHHERGTSGGQLGWYNPVAGTNGSERTTFLSYDIRDLKPAVNNSKMVYVSSAADGKVFIWDVASNTLTNSFSPLGALQLDKVVEYSSGKLVGITGTNVFAFDVAGSLLWTNTLSATAWTGISSYDRRITLGPDGYVWQCAGGYLYRISTVDGSSTQILRTTNDYNTVFLNNADLFLYGGAGSAKVWRVPNALVPDNKATKRRSSASRFSI